MYVGRMMTFDIHASAIRTVIAFASIVLTRSILQVNYGTTLVAQKKKIRSKTRRLQNYAISFSRFYKRDDKSRDTRIDVSRRE